MEWNARGGKNGRLDSVALSMIVVGRGGYICLYLYCTSITGGGVLYIGRYSFLEGFAFVWVGHGEGGFLEILYFELHTELHTGFHEILFVLGMAAYRYL